jgi:hypothetical protein
MDSALTTSRSLSSLRDFFTHERILICFNGPTSRSLIGEIGAVVGAHAGRGTFGVAFFEN